MYNRKEIGPVIARSAEEVLKSLNYFSTITDHIRPDVTKKSPFALITITEAEVNSYDTPCTIRFEYTIAVNALLLNNATKKPSDIKSEVLANLREAFVNHPVIGKYSQTRIAFLGEFTVVDHNSDEDIGDGLLEIALVYKFYVTVLDKAGI